MKEEEFWVAIWRTLTAGVIGIVLSAGGCTVVTNGQDNAAINELVKNGANPLEAKCAIRGSGENERALCTILASKK